MRLPTDTPVDWVEFPSAPEPIWRRAFRSANLRVVTGSRTLLEAIEAGGPFLYYNGVLGRGPVRRRHRPEKIEALLAEWKREGISPALRRDLADFARGSRVASIVRSALTDAKWIAEFPRAWRPVGFRPPYDDAGVLVVAVARTFSTSGVTSPALVGRVRERVFANPAVRRPAPS